MNTEEKGKELKPRMHTNAHEFEKPGFVFISVHPRASAVSKKNWNRNRRE
jgi:hypothetical protein